MAYSLTDFEETIDALALPDDVLACAVSGGPDSMALLYLLSRWSMKHGRKLYAFTVDHGLRPESATEAEMVGAWARANNVSHEVLRWQGDKPQSRVLEEARAARYALLHDAVKRVGAKHLFVAHHQDDQAETFLIRLAKGSGLDGLSGMRSMQKKEDDFVLVRPLLDVTKEQLVSICDDNNVPYVRDPTNENPDYLRPRLRAARAILEEEGLSSKRLAVTAKRLLRARDALDALSDELLERALKNGGAEDFLFDLNILRSAHEELVVRVLLKSLAVLRPDADYAPRMEKVEALVERLVKDPAFNGATLGGCIFAIDRKNGTVWIRKEVAA